MPQGGKDSIKIITEILRMLFKAAQEPFDADKFFAEHARRPLMRLAVQFARDGKILFSTVVQHIKEAFDQGEVEATAFAVQLFEYLKVEAEELEFKLVYDGDTTSKKAASRQTGRRGSRIKKLIDYYGSEAAVKTALVDALRAEVQVNKRGAVTRAHKKVTKAAGATALLRNPRQLFIQFGVDINAILKGETPTATAKKGSAKQQIIGHKQLGNGSEATAKTKLVAMLEKAAKDGKRGAVNRVGKSLWDDFQVKLTVNNTGQLLRSFGIDTNKVTGGADD